MESRKIKHRKQLNEGPFSEPKTLVTFSEPKSIISEQYNTIRTNINFMLSDQQNKKILITSATPGEGKSTIASNLALVFAKEGKRVLIVDADLRKPTLHSTFEIENRFGLSNTLTKKVSYTESMKETFIYGLYVLPSGPVPLNPSELLASKAMDLLIKSIEHFFDIVIFDAPPLLPVTDSQILANKCNGTILVINSGHVNRADVLKAKNILKTSQANILGVILNNYDLPNDHYYYGRYK